MSFLALARLLEDVPRLAQRVEEQLRHHLVRVRVRVRVRVGVRVRVRVRVSCSP